MQGMGHGTPLKAAAEKAQVLATLSGSIATPLTHEFGQDHVHLAPSSSKVRSGIASSKISI